MAAADKEKRGNAGGRKTESAAENRSSRRCFSKVLWSFCFQVFGLCGQQQPHVVTGSFF